MTVARQMSTPAQRSTPALQSTPTPDSTQAATIVPQSPRSGTVPRPGLGAALVSTGVTVAGLLLLVLVARTAELPVFALPFAASAAIVAIAPTAPFAQPRSIVLGHLSAAMVALAAVALAGSSVWTAAVAAGLATLPMLLLRAPHPPATATAALIVLTHPGVSYLLNPLLPACVLVIAAGWLLGLVLKGHRYPATWR